MPLYNRCTAYYIPIHSTHYTNILQHIAQYTCLYIIISSSPSPPLLPAAASWRAISSSMPSSKYLLTLTSYTYIRHTSNEYTNKTKQNTHLQHKYTHHIHVFIHTSDSPFLRLVLTMKSRASAGGGDGSSGCSTTSRSSGSPGTTAQWSNTCIRARVGE